MDKAILSIKPERQMSESFEGYKKRQKNVNAYIKQLRKGTLWWISAHPYSSKRLTFRKKDHGVT